MQGEIFKRGGPPDKLEKGGGGGRTEKTGEFLLLAVWKKKRNEGV